jgi:hypothetical protein
MARTRRTQTASPMGDIIKESSPQSDEILNMPLTTLSEYVRYNKKAREANKKLGVLRYPIKQCPEALHPTEKIIFGRNDQPNNPCPVYISNELIEFNKELIPGKTYILPRCVVDYLSKKGTPIWEKVKNPDGSMDSRKTGKTPRFSIRTIMEE